MLYKIARKLTKDYLDGLSFADRTGGLVRVMKDNRKGEKTFPVEINQDKVMGDNQYLRELTPDSTKTSIMYWEVGSTPDLIEDHVAYNSYRATLKLVCWFNYQKVDPDMYDASYMIAEIKKTIPFKVGSFECLAVVTCNYEGQDDNKGDIFSQYTYNEPESQFFTYPYDYFVMNFEVTYRVVNDCYEEGLDNLPVDPVLITMTGDDAKTVSVSGVSGKEYQTYAYTGDGTVLTARALHEFSGEYQDYIVTPTSCIAEITEFQFGDVDTGSIPISGESECWFIINNTTLSYGIYLNNGTGWGEPSELSGCDFIFAVTASESLGIATGADIATAIKTALEASGDWTGFDTIGINSDTLTFTVTDDGAVTAPTKDALWGTLTITVTQSGGCEDSYFSIDYGREYLRAIDMSDQDVSDITIPDDDNIRLEYIDLSDNAITAEASLVALIQHCYDTGVTGGEIDISGGTNAAITDVTALAQIAEMVTNRGWTITHN